MTQHYVTSYTVVNSILLLIDLLSIPINLIVLLDSQEWYLTVVTNLDHHTSHEEKVLNVSEHHQCNVSVS